MQLRIEARQLVQSTVLESGLAELQDGGEDRQVRIGAPGCRPAGGQTLDNLADGEQVGRLRRSGLAIVTPL